MQKLFWFFTFVLILSSPSLGQLAQIDIPITAVNGQYTRELRLGMDSTATDSIDPALGEYIIPPVPPGTFPFDIRFDIPPYGTGLTSWKDYRYPASIITHKLIWWLNSTDTLILNYVLPAGLSINFKDPFGGILFNSGTLTGTGSYIIPCPSANGAIVTISDGGVIGVPALSFTPAMLNFGNVQSGSYTTLPMTITNTGNSPLVISNITSSNNQFTFTHPAFPITIPAGESTGLNVTFHCVWLGPQIEKLLFTHNAAPVATQYILKANDFHTPAVSDSIKVEDQVIHTQILRFGLDPSATDGYDHQFQEFALPPLPPPGAGDVRFYLPADNFSGYERSFYDYRRMTTAPYSGSVQFRIHIQHPTTSPGAKISWNFPSYLTGVLQDIASGLLGVDVYMSGTGFCIIPPQIELLKMRLDYTNAATANPVELSSFTSVVKGNAVTLNWETATEKNNKGFHVERKTFDSDWENISFINGAGTITEKQFYSYTDNNLSSGSYTYRLRQIDLDGSISYSKEVNAEVNTATEYKLSQNFPNPFNPATIINFSVPQAGPVKIIVYDILGNEVKVLFDEDIQAGTYRTIWNGLNNSGIQMSSGIYIYKLTSGEFVQSKKMILIK